MIYTTTHIDGQVTSKELEKYIINEKGFYYNDCYANFEINDLNINIRVSDFNPLTDQDEVPTFLSCLKNYTLGTKTLPNKDGKEIDVIYECDYNYEVEAWLERNGYFYKKVYGYSHGGLSLALEGYASEQFSCPFDSGVAGYLVMRKEELRRIRGVKRLTPKVLESEIKLYKDLIDSLNNYLDGTQLEARIEGNGIYDSCFVNSLEEICDFITPIINQKIV
ncbi:hypothetical protein ACPDI4_000525 [Campylobacter upsaliensis]